MGIYKNSNLGDQKADATGFFEHSQTENPPSYRRVFCLQLYQLGIWKGAKTEVEAEIMRIDYTNWGFGRAPRPAKMDNDTRSNYTNWGFGRAPRLSMTFSMRMIDYTNWGFGRAPRLKQKGSRLRLHYTNWGFGRAPRQTEKEVWWTHYYTNWGFGRAPRLRLQ